MTLNAPPPDALPRPKVDCHVHHAGLPVPDVQLAVDFYTEKLGFTLGFTWGEPPTLAGANLDEAQVFLELGTANSEGCNLYFVVGDADELFEFQRSQGVEVIEGLADRPYGRELCTWRKAMRQVGWGHG